MLQGHGNDGSYGERCGDRCVNSIVLCCLEEL